MDPSPPRPRRTAIGGIVAVLLVAAVIAVLPLALTLQGGVLLGAWLTGSWDPTWNDGDGWIAAVAAIVLIVIVAGGAALAGAIAAHGRLAVQRTAALSAGVILLGASLPLAVWLLSRTSA